MVLDAHVRAFEFFGGACRKGIYDNLKTVVSKVLLGRDRVFNRRFQNLAFHYLFEPVACTPAARWENGQVERQVGFVRQRFFAKRRKFADLDELNQWLADQCRTVASGHRYPEYPGQTVAEVFAAEQASLVRVKVPSTATRKSRPRPPSPPWSVLTATGTACTSRQQANQ